MINFICDFPFMSLFIFGLIVAFCSAEALEREKLWKHWKKLEVSLYSGVFIMIVAGVFKIAGY